MKISEHPQIDAQHKLFLAVVEKLGAAVRASGIVFVGQGVTWSSRGRSVEGTIVAMPDDSPWLVVVKRRECAKPELRRIDRVSIA